LNDDTAKAAFVSDDGVTSANYDDLPVPAITDDDCQIVGSIADGTTPAMPDACDPLADNNIGSTSSTSENVDEYISGTDPWFKLGSLTNNNSSDAFVIIEFNALVLNLEVDDTDANQVGDVRSNNFNVFVDDTREGAVSNTVDVEIVEPELSIAKSISTVEDTPDAGDTVTYTLVITAADGDHRSTAFDLEITDTLDDFLTPGTASIVVSETTQDSTCLGGTDFDASGSFSDNTLTVTATCLDPGKTITVTVNATIKQEVTPNSVFENEAQLTWTSLPGVQGTTDNPTGSLTPGGNGEAAGQRDGSNDPAANDYNHEDDASFTSAGYDISKAIIGETDLAIGEVVTYELTVTLPEGTSPADAVVTDVLPEGLAYVDESAELDTDGFAGSIVAGDPVISCVDEGGETVACGSSGDNVVFTFINDIIVDAAADDTTNNSFTIRFEALVLNILENQNGEELDNFATLQVDGGAIETSDPVTITVIEPELQPGCWGQGQLQVGGFAPGHEHSRCL